MDSARALPAYRCERPIGLFHDCRSRSTSAKVAIAVIASDERSASDAAVGLSADEARGRLARGGANAIVDVAPHPIRRALDKLWAPVPWMLFVAATAFAFLLDIVKLAMFRRFAVG